MIVLTTWHLESAPKPSNTRFHLPMLDILVLLEQQNVWKCFSVPEKEVCATSITFKCFGPQRNQVWDDFGALTNCNITFAFLCFQPLQWEGPDRRTCRGPWAGQAYIDHRWAWLIMGEFAETRLG
jgi:hypothetical protein